MSTIGERIAVIRSGLGLTQEAFVDAINQQLEAAGAKTITRGAVSNWLSASGKRPLMENLVAIAKLSGATLDWLVDETGPAPDAATVRRKGDQLRRTELFRIADIPLPVAAGPSVPVWGQAAGSTLAEGAIVLFDQPRIGELPFMPGLAGLRDVYGLEVTGDSMMPMYAPGEPIYVSPHTPVRRDDPVVLIEHRSRNGAPRAFIKLFVRELGDRVIAGQLNPHDMDIAFMKAPGLYVHRVLTLRELVGYSGIEVEPQVAPAPRFRKRKS